MKNLNTILPFYETLAEQNKDKEYVDSNCSLVSLVDFLLPFVLRRDHDATDLTNVTLGIYDAADNSLYSSLTPATFLTLDSGTTYDYLSYNGTILTLDLSAGDTYYLILKEGVSNKEWYSERFHAGSKGLTDFITLTFSNDTQLDNILAGYEQKIYIDAVLKTPDYLRIDDAIEKNGINIYRSQIVQKLNNLRIMTAPEFIVDALMLLPMMDNITLLIQNGDEVEVQQVEVEDPEWTSENKGATAKLIVKLTEYTVIKKLNFTEMGCSAQSGDIRQGTAALTKDVQATIVFSSTLAAGYTPDGNAQDVGGNMVLFTIADVTTAGFKVTANKDCTFKWTAIKE